MKIAISQLKCLASCSRLILLNGTFFILLSLSITLFVCSKQSSYEFDNFFSRKNTPNDEVESKETITHTRSESFQNAFSLRNISKQFSHEFDNFFSRNNKPNDELESKETLADSISDSFQNAFSLRNIKDVLSVGDPHKWLFQLETSEIITSSNFLMRSSYRCYDRWFRRLIHLNLCFSALYEANIKPYDPKSDRYLKSDAETSTEWLKKIRQENPLEKERFLAKLLATDSIQTAFVNESQKFLDSLGIFKGFYISDGLNTAFDTSFRIAQKEFLTLVIALFDYLGIVWWVSYGTLIGALRHMDIIPWDDDIDIHMSRSHIARIIGFLHEGHVTTPPDTTYYDVDRFGAKLWDSYKNDQTRDRLWEDTTFRKDLDISLEGRSNSGPAIAKLYWKFADVIPERNYTQLYVDIFEFGFTYTPPSPINNDAISDASWRDAMLSAVPLHISRRWKHDRVDARIIFPLHQRPMGHQMVPVPRQLAEKKQTGAHLHSPHFFEECTSGHWNHILETHRKYHTTIPCEQLYSRVPFVTYRVKGHIPRHNVPMFLQPNFNMNVDDLFIEQINYDRFLLKLPPLNNDEVTPGNFFLNSSHPAESPKINDLDFDLLISKLRPPEYRTSSLGRLQMNFLWPTHSIYEDLNVESMGHEKLFIKDVLLKELLVFGSDGV